MPPPKGENERKSNEQKKKGERWRRNRAGKNVRRIEQ